MWTQDERLRFVYAFMKYEGQDIILDFWQDAFVKSASKFSIVLKSRQTGFSFATALKGIVKAMDPMRTNYTKQFISYNESDALEKIRYAKMFYEGLPRQVRKKIVTDNKTCLEFQDINSNTTSRLISFPCRAPRGKNGDICLDEYAIYQPRMSDVIYTAALPLISNKGCLEMGSTPLGKIGKFYEVWTDRKQYNKYQHFYVMWYFARALCKDVEGAVDNAPNLSTEERVDRYGTDAIKKIFSNMSLDTFQQEYECLFIDSAESYITLDLIDKNTPGRLYQDIDNLEIQEASSESIKEYAQDAYGKELVVYHTADGLILNYNVDKHGSPIYVGYDVAKSSDAISIIGLTKYKGKRRMLFRIEEHNKEFEWQKNTIRRIMKELPVYRCDVDATGMGAPIYEELHKEFGDRIEGYIFTIASKEVLAMEVKRGLERCEYMLENDRGFHNQLHSIKRLPATGQHFRYDSEHTAGLHADSFWSLALASYAMSGIGSKYNFLKRYTDDKDNDASDKGARKRVRGKTLEQVLRGIR